MNGLIWIAHTLEAALLLAWLVFALGLFGLFRWWLRRPVYPQVQREARFLAHQTALFHATRQISQLRAAA